MRQRWMWLVLACLLASAGFAADEWAAARREMVETQIRGRGIRDRRVIEALLQVPRHEFVPERYREYAYSDLALPIGEGQTISQPYIVAEMTKALSLSGTEKVLEIGTGSGYQAAILARLAREVVTLERLSSLQEHARSVLAELGIANVRFLVGDGSLGAPGEAPFDRIVVTAAAPDVPAPLFDQLADGGIMVIPVGGRWEQELLRVRKEGRTARKEYLGGCRFVPLVGECGFPD